MRHVHLHVDGVRGIGMVWPLVRSPIHQKQTNFPISYLCVCVIIDSNYYEKRLFPFQSRRRTQSLKNCARWLVLCTNIGAYHDRIIRPSTVYVRYAFAERSDPDSSRRGTHRGTASDIERRSYRMRLRLRDPGPAGASRMLCPMIIVSK
jgi:hypothetical protein